MADCPVWLHFLDEVTQGDEKLIRFLQQYYGYALTASPASTRFCSFMDLAATARAYCRKLWWSSSVTMPSQRR